MFTVVVSSLTDGADDVVRRSLAVLAEICSSSTQQPGAFFTHYSKRGSRVWPSASRRKRTSFFESLLSPYSVFRCSLAAESGQLETAPSVFA